MSSPNTSVEKVPTAREIMERLAAALNEVAQVAREMVRAIETRPELYRELIEEGLGENNLKHLMRVGSGQIIPALIEPKNYAQKQLTYFPPTEQARILQQGVEVMEPDEQTTRLIPINDLLPAQVRQVFHQGRYRSLAEQRSWLVAQKAKRAPRLPVLDVVVRGQSVVIKTPGTYNKSQILQWLSEMK